MGETATLDYVFQLAKQLPSIDKVRLIERIAPEIEQDLAGPVTAERQSLRGLWKGLDITAEDIDEARQEMWGGFPREDI